MTVVRCMSVLTHAVEFLLSVPSFFIKYIKFPDSSELELECSLVVRKSQIFRFSGINGQATQNGMRSMTTNFLEISLKHGTIEWGQSTHMDWIKFSVRNSRNVTKYEDRHLKKAWDYNGWNVVSITNMIMLARSHSRSMTSIFPLYNYFRGNFADELSSLLPRLHEFKRTFRLATGSHCITVEITRCNRNFYSNTV